MATETGSDQAEGGTETVDSSDEEVEFGLEPNLAAALCYIPIVGLVYLFVEDDNEFVLFNAAQSLVYWVVWQFAGFVFGIVFGIFFGIIGLGFIADLTGTFINLGGFLLLAFMAYKAYSGEHFEFPVIAGVAESVKDSL